MKHRKLTIPLAALFVVAFLQLTSFGQEPALYSKLKPIQLLETKRSEAEALLQPVEITKTSKSAVGLVVEYRIPNASVSIVYSHGKCSSNGAYGYDVEKDAVTEIELKLQKPVSIAKFGFDLSKFERSEIEDVAGLFTYRNEAEGELFYGTSTELSNIILSPSKEQQKLACENKPNNAKQ